MTHLQLTPEQPVAEMAEQPAADELRRAQARRLEIMELERASDEGMPTPQRARSRVEKPGGQEENVEA